MSEIGTERVEPTSRLPDQLSNEPRRDPRSRPRHRTPPPDANGSEPPNDLENSHHQVDSMA